MNSASLPSPRKLAFTLPAVALGATQASAGIVYFNLDTPVSATEESSFLYFNMLTGATTNIYSNTYDLDGGFAFNYKLFPGYCYSQISPYDNSSNSTYLTLSSDLGGNPYTNMLSLNDPINSSSSFQQWASFFNMNESTPTSYWTNDNTIGYIGLTFTHDSNTYYGWVKASVDSAGLTTIYSMGYNDTPSAEILAGQGVPEPSDAAAIAGILAGSAAAFGALRRRRKMAFAA